ncbi:spore coat protein YsxE [Bacillus sp. 165]|uniref:spore coat protein YsxE n=1 Tax=Bacillus sp. 165 TaxID=1529117 RepID=UPI001ADBB69A|nr:spore coat protein YsxE [Bacillus sp. 165]MBO9130514.1 spore coat protein YsxE [Bacillus sp. 165]
METAVREKYSGLLQMYQLKPDYFENYGNVTKVYTNQGAYALKKINHDRMSRNPFMRHIQMLTEKGFTHYAPIYHTQDGRYVLYDEENSYYLMPWLEQMDQSSDENDRYHKMFRTLALMHQKTQREETINEKMITQHYEVIQKRWEEERNGLDQFLTGCESSWYMSPFELQFVSHYHHVMRAHEFATKKMEQWYEAMKEKEKTRVSLIHGNLSSQHFLFDYQRNGYFISLENSGYSSPITDLVTFYLRTFQTYPVARNDRYEWFQEYEKNFPLQQEEKTLMLGYMAYPQKFINQVIRYSNTENARDERNELSHAKLLQHSEWLISNTEYFITQLQAAEQQAEQSQQ